MGKLTKVAIVVLLAVVVVAVMANKKSSTTSLSIQPTAQAGIPRLVDLGSTTCIPCKMMAPVLEELRSEYAGRLQVDFIDVNVNEQAAVPFNIQMIPTQVFLDASGKELWRHEGFLSKEDILAKWKELGIQLTAPADAPTTAPTTLPAVPSGGARGIKQLINPPLSMSIART